MITMEDDCYEKPWGPVVRAISGQEIRTFRSISFGRCRACTKVESGISNTNFSVPWFMLQTVLLKTELSAAEQAAWCVVMQRCCCERAACA
jgi:hypothetical protein